MKTVIAILIATVILVVFYDYSLNQRVSWLGFQPQNISSNAAKPPYGRAVLSLLAMVVGVTFGSLYERIRQSDDKINVGKEIRATFSSGYFFKALLVAPLVFSGIYSAANAQPDHVIAGLFAFQNGFFCQSIFLEKKKNKSF